ncbi:MAG: signal peptidase I [Clostridia bacterium]|nr:signal peptidase I [Clostridia bacterium]
MKKLGKIVKAIIVLLLIVVLFINITIIVQIKTKPDSVPNVMGLKPFIVLSDSMESNIHVGDLIIVKIIDTNELNVGDVIAFRDSTDIVTTHRIVSIDTTGATPSFTTKGDANNANDDLLVTSDMVEGKYIYRVLGLGQAILFIQEPLGFITIMLSIFIVCMLIYLFQNRNLNTEIQFKNEEEKKAYEEFLKTRNNVQNQENSKEDSK